MRLQFFLAITLVMGLWSSSVPAQLLDENEVFRSYLTSRPPVIDGMIEPNEWAAAGPPIVVNNDVRPDAIGGDDLEPYGGASDLSFQFRSMWSPPWDIYFLVEVTDDVAMDDAHNLADRAWERDQVELFIDGDQLTGGNIQWWTTTDTGPQETYGKFGVARTNEFEGNTGIMNPDPEEVGEFGVSGSGVATETGENANYFVEYHISMLEASNNGLFDGTDAGNFDTMVPELTAIKFQVGLSDNDNFGDETGVRSHGGTPYNSGLDAQGCTEKLNLDGVGTEMICGEDAWWRSDTYPNLLMSSEYVPDVGLRCDFDEDGVCDINDMDALTLEVANAPANPDPIFNLDDDPNGVVGAADQDRWLELAGEANGFSGPYLRGDANLDGRVDAGDLNIIAINWNSSQNRWSEGNVVGSGVAADDLNALALNWQSETPLAASQIAVPEPNCLYLALLVMLGFGRTRNLVSAAMR